MHSSTVQEHIRNFIVDRFPLARKRNINSTELLLEKGVVDSLGVLDLVSFLEEQFTITITDEELIPENFQTIERLTVFVQNKHNGATEE